MTQVRFHSWLKIEPVYICIIFDKIVVRMVLNTGLHIVDWWKRSYLKSVVLTLHLNQTPLFLQFTIYFSPSHGKILVWKSEIGEFRFWKRAVNLQVLYLRQN